MLIRKMNLAEIADNLETHYKWLNDCCVSEK